MLLAFGRALDAIAERDPDLVVHAGDFFHWVRPSNGTIVHAFRRLSSFQTKRQGRPFLIVGGNHDTPKTREIGNILGLFASIPGVYVESVDARSFDLGGGLHVLAAPSMAMSQQDKWELEPDAHSRFNVLVAHAPFREVIFNAPFSVLDLKPERWSYVALGDIHFHQVFASNCCYSGATEFSETDPWSSVDRPRGWVWYDTEVGEIEFVPVATRKFIDLPVIDASGLSGLEIVDRMLAQAVWDDDDNPVVRQKVNGISPEALEHIDRVRVNSLIDRCLDYYADLRGVGRASGRLEETTAARSIEQEWEEWIGAFDARREFDRETARVLGADYLRKVLDDSEPTEAR